MVGWAVQNNMTNTPESLLQRCGIYKILKSDSPGTLNPSRPFSQIVPLSTSPGTGGEEMAGNEQIPFPPGPATPIPRDAIIVLRSEAILT